MNIEVVIERFLLAAAILGAGVAAYALVNRLLLRRAASRLARLASYQPGLPVLVYFTTPGCLPCRTIQRPAIERLQTRFGRCFQVIEVDASRHSRLAREWGVMSVPTTFIFDANGKPRYVNHGVTQAETLMRQLELEDFSVVA